MAPSDDWRPYTIPYSGDGAVKRPDGTWVPSSKAHTTPPILCPQQPASSASSPPTPSAAADTSATAANDPAASSYTYTEGPYTSAGFPVREGPDIPSMPAPSPFVQAAHPRFAKERGPGEGIPCAGGNPPAGSWKGERGGNVENSENGQAGEN